MKTTPIYRVLAKDATLLVAFVSEPRAMYAWATDPRADRVVKGPMTIAQKNTREYDQTPVAVYSTLRGDVLRMAVPVGTTWTEALALAPRNYALMEVQHG